MTVITMMVMRTAIAMMVMRTMITMMVMRTAIAWNEESGRQRSSLLQWLATPSPLRQM